MKIEAVDITTSLALANPEQVYRVAGAVNKWEGGYKPVGVEVYPFVRPFPHRVSAVNAEEIKLWQEKYGAQTVRLHLPWMYSKREFYTKSWEIGIRGQI